MGLFDYDVARRQFNNDSLITQIINCLEDEDCYHLLRCGNENAEIPFQTPNEEYKQWLFVCDGGLLFSTTLLGITDYDEKLDLSFSTLQEYNTQKQKRLYGLPKGFHVIAVLNYGDPICVSDSDSKVYLWDTQENEFATVWESFADFLADEYNTAIQMIQEGALEPVPMKVTEEQDG